MLFILAITPFHNTQLLAHLPCHRRKNSSGALLCTFDSAVGIIWLYNNAIRASLRLFHNYDCHFNVKHSCIVSVTPTRLTNYVDRGKWYHSAGCLWHSTINFLRKITKILLIKILNIARAARVYMRANFRIVLIWWRVIIRYPRDSISFYKNELPRENLLFRLKRLLQPIRLGCRRHIRLYIPRSIQSANFRKTFPAGLPSSTVPHRTCT